MTYAGVEMFMEKLKQLINCNDHPSINNWTIRRRRHEFRLLYEDLGSMIRTLFIGEHQDLHELEKVNDLKERFIYAAEEAQFIVDLYVSGVQIRRSSNSIVDLVLSCVYICINGCFPTSTNFEGSLNLVDVRRSFKSVKEEFTSMINDNTKMDASQRTERTLNQSTSVAAGSKKLLDEIIVGIDDDAKLIKDKLMEDRKKLDVVSVVGMGGIGKTTLATKVFNDAYVKYHFHVRVWVTVSQTYDKRHVLIQILESICGRSDLKDASDSRLRELVHKQLTGKRYLIVIDDIWHIETWDNLKLFFPHGYNGSRILLTSRISEVAEHATTYGLIHHLGCLNKERSWELLRRKVFYGDECPEWSIKLGMQIVENCQGLPLALVVIAGVLAKEAWSEKLWVEIADKAGSYIAGLENGSIMESLALSYNHLPLHLRECFLYLGGFPEDYKFQVKRLIWLWIAEGFIQEDGNRSLEDVAEGYLMDLIDRNLVIITDRRPFNGGAKYCVLHDLVRELCLSKAKEDGLILQIGRLEASSRFSDVTTTSYKPVRMFMDKDPNIVHFSYPSDQKLRSILCFDDFISLSDDIAKYFRSFVLLRVLDLHKCSLNDFPKGMELLVHLRYLAVQTSTKYFPPLICNLWNLQTLIYNTEEPGLIVLPPKISDLVNLRHLISSKVTFFFTVLQKPMNLQTISKVRLEHSRWFFHFFPCIKELSCETRINDHRYFEKLSYLEKLKLTGPLTSHAFPESLKTLALAKCFLSWSDMSNIHLLPNLQVLKLHYNAFEGSCWNTHEQVFQHLKFLRFDGLNINTWEACSSSFPCLRRLEICYCSRLEEIAYEIGEIPTLELIKIESCKTSVGESVRRIQDNQHDFGNYNLTIEISENT
ncbi:hypothetical protein R6Q57_015945 [Mikania cordata]